MTEDRMNRTRLLRDQLESLPWDQTILYSELDALDKDKTNSRRLSVIENSGEAFNISYDAVNYMTYFLHHPAQALEALIRIFHDGVKEKIIESSSEEETSTTILVDGDEKVVRSRQSLVQAAAGLNEIEGRGVGDIERYYVTPYIRLVRKNYGHFDFDYAKIRGTGYFVPRTTMTKVIHSEEAASSATDW